jgi:hypothetical protein
VPVLVALAMVVLRPVLWGATSLSGLPRGRPARRRGAASFGDAAHPMTRVFVQLERDLPTTNGSFCVWRLA